MIATRVSSVVLALSLVPAFGCGKEDEPKSAPTGERTKEPEPETPKDAPSGPFVGFDFEAAKAAWQGSWTLEGDVIGSKVAWMVDGDLLVEFDGETERKLAFTVYSPCQVTHTDAEAGVTTYKSFTRVGDILHAGLGSAGAVAGDATIVCDGGKTYVLRGDVCEAWSEMFDDWKSQPATCTVEGEGEARKFVVDGREVPFLGPAALGTSQMKANVVTRYPNFEAAKAALAGGDEPAP